MINSSILSFILRRAGNTKTRIELVLQVEINLGLLIIRCDGEYILFTLMDFHRLKISNENDSAKAKNGVNIKVFNININSFKDLFG